MLSDIDERTDATRLSRYDVVLAVIPTVFLLAGVATQVLSASLPVVLSGAGGVAALALFDAMFVNPPRTGSGTA